MIDIQNKLLTLLREVNTMCEENGIHCFMFGRSLIQTVRSQGFEPNTLSLMVAITSKDVPAFVKCMEKNMDHENRYLESMLNNSEFPSTGELLYGDRNSLDINTNNWGYYKNYGIKITIRIIRSDENSEFSRRYHQFLESTWKMRGVTKSSKKSTQTLYRLADKYYSFTGRDKSAKRIFTRLAMKDYSNTRYYEKKVKVQGRRYFERSDFEDFIKMKYEDVDVLVPSGYENILSTIYGADWRELGDLNEVNPIVRIVDANIPYGELYSELQAKHVDTDKIWNLRYSYIQQQKAYTALNSRVQKIWTYLFYAGDRINLWLYYKDRKDELKVLYSEKKYDELTVEMTPYIECTEKYAKSKIGMYIGEDMFNYYSAVMEHQGQIEYVEKVKGWIPESMMSDIVIKDYKGNR